MKKLILLLLTMFLYGTIYSQPLLYATIDTEHEYIIDGIISAQELKKQRQLFLLLHPEYKQKAVDSGKEVEIPSYIKLMKFKPNPYYISSVKNNYVAPIHNTKLSGYIMLDVSPIILDQGKFGTCVTFSTLGAIMSAEHVTDKNNAPSISCMLQMMTSTNYEWYIHPWDGLYIYDIGNLLNSQKGYVYSGFVTENFGLQGGCNRNYKTYEPRGSDDQKIARLDRDTNYMNNSKGYIHGQGYEHFRVIDAHDGLARIKEGIYTNRYTVFSFWYDYPPHVFPELPAYAVWTDDGVPPSYNGGHAIFAYGYDDRTVVNGQKGILYIRNSWGNTIKFEAMTYDFFLRKFRADDTIIQFKPAV